MTRFGVKPWGGNKIIFNSDIKFVYVLSNVDRKYYQCIPKKEVAVQLSLALNVKLLVHTKERWHERIPLFCQNKYFFTLKTLLAPPNAPLDVEIVLHRPYLAV